jgi:hypothetical protein
VAAIAASIAAAAPGRDDSEPVRLEYQADPACPTRAAFIDDVRARTSRARFTDDDPKARTIRVWARVSAGRGTGRLETGASAPRQVSAESCADVVSALALIAALTIDPQASTAPVRTATAGAPSATVSAAPIPAPAPRAPASTEPAPAPPPPPAAAVPSAPTPRFLGLGARFDAFGLSGIHLLGGSAWVEAGLLQARLFAPSLRLSARYGVSPSVAAGDASASFSLFAGRVEASAPRLELGRASLVPALFFELGNLRGEATPGSVVYTQTTGVEGRLWLLLGEALALEIRVVDGAYLSLGAEIDEPLQRYDFYFRNPSRQDSAWTVPEVEVAAHLGAGVRFW